MSTVPVLRFASLLALVLWVGGLAVLGGIGAPTIFAVLESHDPIAGRALAGVVFGAIFERFQYLAWALGALLLLLIGARAALGPRPRWFGLRMWTVTLMLAMSLATGLVLAPRIDAIRESVAGPVASLPSTDARQIEFGRLHGLSNVLMLVTLLGGIGLLWAEMRDSPY
jgi:quinol-cytochrome oxidoreductase complex cytochrome b subunit